MSEAITLENYKRAERELTMEETRRGFRMHAAFYIGVNIALIILNLVTEPDYLWFFFPLVGWGIGLAMHYLFDVRPVGRNTTQRQERIEQRALQWS